MSSRYIVRSGDGEPMTVSVVEHDEGYRLIIGDEVVEVDSCLPPGTPTRSLLIEGRSYEAVAVPERDGMSVFVSGDVFSIKVVDELWARAEAREEADTGGETLLSPMPGAVVKVLVEKGQMVQPGDPVIIVEAMKMQNELAAVRGGRVDSIEVAEADVVDQDQVLVVMVEAEEE